MAISEIVATQSMGPVVDARQQDGRVGDDAKAGSQCAAIRKQPIAIPPTMRLEKNRGLTLRNNARSLLERSVITQDVTAVRLWSSDTYERAPV